MAWITQNYEWILLLLVGILELVLRYVPTAKNLSIIDTIVRIIRMIVPNNKKTNNPTIPQGLPSNKHYK